METMGQVFKAARERKRISLSTAAAKTRIKIQHLEMMERDDFSQMPAPTYARGFIRIYADFLGLEAGPLIEEYNKLHAPGARGKRAEPMPARPPDAATPGDAPSAAPASAPKTKQPGTRISIWPKITASLRRAITPGNVRRAAIVIAIALGAVAITYGVRRCAREGRFASEARAPRRAAPALVEEPPDAYLPIPDQPGAAP
jgi:hypothetical protein